MATLLSMACPCASGPLNSDDPREGELISKAIDTLTWESMNGSHSGPSPGSDEAKYLQGLGTRASAQLVDVLEDPDRGVAAHVVLSHIWNCSHTYREDYSFDSKGSISGWTSECDGVRWTYRDRKESAEPAELAINARRCRERLGL